MTFIRGALVAGLWLACEYASAAAPFGLASRVSVQGLRFPFTRADVPETVVEHVGTFFDAPVYVTSAPGDAGHLYVVERTGDILRLDRDLQFGSLFLHVDTDLGFEGGLLGLAFDPDYAVNRRFYVYYTLPDSVARVSRFRAHATGRTANPATEQVLLSMTRPSSAHVGGTLLVGPDRKLYLSSGDGFISSNAQQLDNLFGKILRLNLDGSIPEDNPFQVTGLRPEIWAYGLRNPFRMSFDPATGQLWVGDVGASSREEVDLVQRGGNYGWDIYEAEDSYNNPDGLPAGSFIAPVHSYGHDTGRAITGGAVYRGPSIPALRGSYVYGDFETGRLWAMLASPDGRFAGERALPSVEAPSSFGRGPDGELYVTSLGGAIYAIRPNPALRSFPGKLSRTGLFTDLATLAPAPGLIEYAVNAPGWLDGASARRWVALPGTAKIRFSATEPWRFPHRTVLVQHIEITSSDGRQKRLETRILIHQATGWEGYSYRWNDDGTDATLIDDAQTTTVQVMDDAHPGQTRSLTWAFPSRGACLGCHNEGAGNVLGLRTTQVNRTFDYAGVSDNQLRSFDHIQLFTRDIGPPTWYLRLPDRADTEAPTRARARGWLDANCSSCHRGDGDPSNLDLRYTATTEQMHAVNVAPKFGDLGIPNAVLIKPGFKNMSVLWQRMGRLDAPHMPPYGNLTSDPIGVQDVGAWIDGGAP